MLTKLYSRAERWGRTFVKKLTAGQFLSVGIAERKEREKEFRRSSIIDAAERVFFRKGVDDATMDDVAAEAELSKGTLYLYFKSKIELLAAIHVRGMDLLAAQMEDSVVQPGSGLDHLRRMAQVFVRFSVEHPEYFSFVYLVDKLQSTDELSGGPWHEECQHRNDRLLLLSVEAIDRGVADGSISVRMPARELALLLWAGVRGVVQLYHIKRKYPVSEIFTDVNRSLDQLMTSYFELLSHGLAGPAAGLRPGAHKNAS